MPPRAEPLPAASASTTAASPSAIEAVFDRLVADIVRGTYPPASRLPAERELSRILGASRPTLREALRRLTEWNMVIARRGSGIVVRDLREWMIEALPAYLKHARPGPDRPSVAALARDMLLLRRTSMVDLLRMLAGRVPEGGTQVARVHAERAWQRRSDLVAFATEDFQCIRALAEAARAYPAMWMVNRISGVYLDIARSLAGAIAPPADYLDVYARVFQAVERGDADTAGRELDEYLERHDSKILALLERMR